MSDEKAEFVPELDDAHQSSSGGSIDSDDDSEGNAEQKMFGKKQKKKGRKEPLSKIDKRKTR